MTQATRIKVEALVKAPVADVWKAWNRPEDIMNWNTADPGWHCPSSENDLREGGSFKNRMEARDGSFGFDFEGRYDRVEPHKEISYTMSDGRRATTLFSEKDSGTSVSTSFDAESQNDPEFQKQGWQAILDNFKKYVEANR